mmetsp:Transcript_94517/g.289165  ORF Transcript_94517/g.289165 Transcript_94517/m.289165 type:complete len:374 (-) Transcript_94517:339-1460(-)
MSWNKLAFHAYVPVKLMRNLASALGSPARSCSRPSSPMPPQREKSRFRDSSAWGRPSARRCKAVSPMEAPCMSKVSSRSFGGKHAITESISWSRNASRPARSSDRLVRCTSAWMAWASPSARGDAVDRTRRKNVRAKRLRNLRLASVNRACSSGGAPVKSNPATLFKMWSRSAATDAWALTMSKARPASIRLGGKLRSRLVFAAVPAPGSTRSMWASECVRPRVTSSTLWPWKDTTSKGESACSKQHVSSNAHHTRRNGMPGVSLAEPPFKMSSTLNSAITKALKKLVLRGSSLISSPSECWRFAYAQTQKATSSPSSRCFAMNSTHFRKCKTGSPHQWLMNQAGGCSRSVSTSTMAQFRSLVAGRITHAFMW